jgi:hypothetical protein
MGFLTVLALLLPLLNWLLSLLKPATQARLSPAVQAKLAHVAGLCLQVAGESSRVGDEPQIDPAQQMDHTL